MMSLFLVVVVSLDDFVALATFGPVGQVATSALVHHFRGGGHGLGQFLGLFETFFLALVDDVGLAAIQAAADEVAAGFQNFLGSRHAFRGVGIALSQKFGQFGGLGSAFGLARFRRRLGNFDQAADAGLEIFIAAQFEQAQEFLDAFAFRRFGARVDASFSLGGDRAHFRPGFRGAKTIGDDGGALDAVLEESTNFGAAFRGHRVFRGQVTKLRISTQFGLDGFPACRQAWVVVLVMVGEDATEGGQ